MCRTVSIDVSLCDFITDWSRYLHREKSDGGKLKSYGGKISFEPIIN